MKMINYMTDEEKAAARTLRLQGMGIREIARAINKAYPTVRRCLLADDPTRARFHPDLLTWMHG